MSPAVEVVLIFIFLGCALAGSLFALAMTFFGEEIFALLARIRDLAARRRL